ncbi:unnamed protein product [Prunus brigantina]
MGLRLFQALIKREIGPINTLFAFSNWDTLLEMVKVSDTYLNSIKGIKLNQSIINPYWIDLALTYVILPNISARQKVVEIIKGTYASQYSKLWEYCAKVRETNVGSIIMMKIEAPYF